MFSEMFKCGDPPDYKSINQHALIKLRKTYANTTQDKHLPLNFSFKIIVTSIATGKVLICKTLQDR